MSNYSKLKSYINNLDNLRSIFQARLDKQVLLNGTNLNYYTERDSMSTELYHSLSNLSIDYLTFSIIKIDEELGPLKEKMEAIEKLLEE